MRQLVVGLLVGAAFAPSVVLAQAPDAGGHGAELLRLVKRAVAWYPDSTFRIGSNDRTQTPSGAYRMVTVERECASEMLSGAVSVLVDEMAGVMWIGSVARLPFRQAGIEPTALGKFLQDFLPEALRTNLNINVTVDWARGSHRSGALIPFTLLVDTGYGVFRKQAAVTSEGEYVVLGAPFPMDQDPVTYRRQMLASSDLVVWDVDGMARENMVEIVEFSDLECPACRHKWPLIKQTLEAHQGKLRHGMVSFPLTTIHPWAFRSACATWCVAEQDQGSLLQFKELFYSLQPEMEVSLVTPTSLDFVAGSGLDETSFKGCYLRQPSLDAVHGQLALGHLLGVVATPTYFVNGWLVQVPSEDWFGPMIERLIAGDDLS